MNNKENQNHDDLFEEAARALREAQIPNGPPDELVAQVVAAAKAADNQPSSHTSTAPLKLGARINIIKTIKTIAIATSLLVAASALFAWLAMESQSLAFADVAKAFANVRTAKCKQIVTIEGTQIPEQKSRILFLAPATERIEMEGIEVKKKGRDEEISDPFMIYDWEKKKALSVTPSHKLALTIDLSHPAKHGQATSSFIPYNTFDKLRRQILRAQQGAENTKSLGKQTIDGKTAIGFRIIEGNVETKIWADPKTELPVLVEHKTVFEVVGNDVFAFAVASDNVRQTVSKIILKDFEYNMELDKSLFDLTVPKGYKVEEYNSYFAQLVDSFQASINDLAEALKVYAKYHAGVFPKTLFGEDGIEKDANETTRQVVAEHGIDSTKFDEETMKILGNLEVLRSIVQTLPPKNCHYAGAGVKLGDAEKPIFWLKPKGSETYQVLYGDLRVVEGVAEKDLPQVP